MTNGLIAEGRPVRKWAAAALISYYYYRYFPKIFFNLVSAGWARSQREIGGGLFTIVPRVSGANPVQGVHCALN